MQNQITNQLLLFGIRPHEYSYSIHPDGVTEITVAGHTVATYPGAIQFDRQYTIDRIPKDSTVLAVSTVIAALLRRRRPESGGLPRPAVPTPPAPHKPQHGAAGAPWDKLGALPIPPPLGANQIPLQVNPEAMVETSSPCGGEAATIPVLGKYPTDNHSPESYE